MLKFLQDAIAIFRLRFQNVEHYRYPPTVMLAALLILSMVNAGLFAAYIGTPPAVTVGLMVGITAVKWLTLAFVMQIFLHYKGAPKMNLLGFVLLSEFLNVPLIVMSYAPALAIIGLAWQFWALLVQIRGLLHFSRVQPIWLLLAYLLYAVAASLLGMLVLSFFVANGWIDAEAMLQQMKAAQSVQ
ncbi:MAG: hypothetical protein Q4G42_08970 [Neisseria sp.]|nr:hypothetical protein [Neisseria sp.]